MKELTPLEELKDAGFEIIDYTTKDDPDGLKKISICLQFYNDESWDLDSMNQEGLNVTLDSGSDLRKILPTIRYYRDLLLKAIK